MADRNHLGRFTQGNTCAKGNPHAKKVQAFRAAMLKAVTPNDIKDIIRCMVDLAKGGDVVAAKFVIERLLGKDDDVGENVVQRTVLLPPQDPLVGGVGLKKIHDDVK